MNKRTPPKQKPKKFTGNTKVTLVALSMISFIGGWNLIARSEDQKMQPVQSTVVPQLPAAIQPSASLLPVPTATPWPTIAPLPTLPTISSFTAAQQLGDHVDADGVQSASGQGQTAPIQLAPQALVAPLPTLAPLPAMAPLPAVPVPPPPPPVIVWTDGGGNYSGGS